MAMQLSLSPIQTKTKGDIKKLRQSGFVPVSIQHKGMPTAHYQLEAKPLDDFIKRHGQASLIDLVTSTDNRRQRALVCDVQRDPISQKLLHVTFQQVRSDDRLKTNVPLVYQGEPEEVRLGTAITQHSLDHLEIECAPESLPDHIYVDISNLVPGHPIRIADLPAHPGYTIVSPPDTVLASLSSTQKGKEEDTVAEEETVPAV